MFTTFCSCHGRSSSAQLLHWDVTPPWRMKLQRMTLIVAFLLDVLFALCTRLPPPASVLTSLRLPAWSSAHSWLLRLRFRSMSAPVLLPAPSYVLHVTTPVRCGQCLPQAGMISELFFAVAMALNMVTTRRDAREAGPGIFPHALRRCCSWMNGNVLLYFTDTTKTF